MEEAPGYNRRGVANERVDSRVARKDKKVRFTTLMHHVYSLDTLRGAYFSLKRDCRSGGGREDVARVRGATGREHQGPLRTLEVRSVSSEAPAPSVHTQAGRPAGK